MCVRSFKGKNCFDTEIKLCIVTRHCLTGTRDEGRRMGGVTDGAAEREGDEWSDVAWKKGMHAG